MPPPFAPILRSRSFPVVPLPDNRSDTQSAFDIPWSHPSNFLPTLHLVREFLCYTICGRHPFYAFRPKKKQLFLHRGNGIIYSISTDLNDLFHSRCLRIRDSRSQGIDQKGRQHFLCKGYNVLPSLQTIWFCSKRNPSGSSDTPRRARLSPPPS